MAKQTSKTSLLRTTTTALQSVDATKYFDATLQGSGLSATAHTSLSKINSVFIGDTLTARGNNNTLIGGAGNDSLVSSGSNNLLVASAGNDTLVSGPNGATFQVANVAQLAASSISGGAGSDTLRITTAAKLVDGNFSRVKGVEVLSLTGASSAVLDAGAKNAGINFVVAGTGNSTLSQGAGYSGSLTIAGGAGKDLITVATGSQLAADSIVGGGALDTLVVSAASSLNDASFSKVSGVEALSLTGASAVTLGGNAGFSTVIAGSITQTSANNVAVRMLGSAANDSFTVATAAQLAADTLVAGAGSDTLSISQAQTITDAALANASGVEVLSLGGNSTVTLDKNASKAGIATVVAASGASLDLSVTSGNTSNLSLNGGSSGDVFRFNDLKPLSRSSIQGGGGNDTLVLGVSGAINDSLFGNIRSVEAVSLSGGNTVTIGKAAADAGVATIFGGTSTLGSVYTQTTLSSGAQTIVSGNGNDLFVLGADTLLANDYLVGGGGTDTLRINSDSTLASGSMDNISGIEVLQLSGKSSLVSANVPTGLNTIIGGNGNSSYSITSPGKLNIIAGTGDDVFRLSGSDLLSDSLKAVTLSGGKGIDSLIVEGASAVNDAFSNVSGTEVLSLNGAASVTLGGASKTAGFNQVFTGGASTLGVAVAQTEEATQNLSITTGKGNDTISVANGVLLSKDTIDGGDGVNTLRVESASRLLDRSFATVSSTQVLSLIDDGNYVELGTNAAGTAGIATILGVGSGNTLNASKYDGDVLTFNVAASDGGNVLTGTSAAGNLFLVGEGALGTTTITGGTNKDGDTLSVALSDGLSDSMFSATRGVEVLSLSGAGTLDLGAKAISAGLKSVFGGEGDMVFNRSAGALEITADETSKSNLFSYSSADVAGRDTVTGAGKGNDTLQIETAAVIGDTLFANKTGIQVISLSGSSSIELGAAAEEFAGANTDPTSLFGGSGSSTITQIAAAPFHIEVSEGTNNYIKLSADLLAADGDTIVGSESADTLAVTGDEVTDEAFANVSGIAALQIVGDSLGNGSVTLDANASAAAFASVIGSTGKMTFSLTSLPDSGYLLDGSAGDTNLFSFTEETLKATGKPDTINSASSILAANTLIGGIGIDTIFLASDDDDVNVDEKLANVSGVEILSLSGSTAVTLDSLAGSKGLSSVFGGDGDMTINLNGGSYSVNSSGASSNLFNLGDATLLGINTLTGSDGEDTLSVASGNLADTLFANLSGVPVIQLAGDHSATFGQFASLSGVSTVYGGEGDVTVDLLAGSYDFEAGDAKGTFRINAADSAVMGASTFTGNGEGSTIAFSEGDVTDDAFANVKAVGSILLEGSSSITLDESASKIGNDTLTVSVVGGAGDTTFIQTAGSFVLDGSAGNSNLFALSSAALAAGDTILGTGNDGSDVLAITEDDTLVGDSTFADISGVGILSLTGSSNATLGANAAKTGIVDVELGDGDSRINLAAGAPEVLVNGAIASSVFVGIAQASLAAATTLIGSAEGTDTLGFGAANTIEDESFSNVSGFEVISVTGGSSVTLGAAAAAGGLDSIYGGAGINTITQGIENANALYINGGSGQLRAELDNVYYLVNDTILGGTGGQNTLSVNSAGNIFDSYFANQQRLQTVVLAGDNNVELGAGASDAGVARVIVEDGDNSFTVAADGPAGVTLDASAGKGDNSFAFDSADQLVTARIYGADGTDTLSFATDSSIADTLFARADSIEVLQLSGASDVTLGTYADSTGIATVIGGSGGTTFTRDALSSNDFYLDGSADSENGNLFVVANAAQVAGSTLFGGDAFDTLQVLSGAVDDIAFRNISSVEVLRLSGSGTAFLGSYADQSGLLTVVGGAGSNTYSHDAASQYSYYLDGSGGSRNLFVAADAALAAVDTYVGGAGSDTLRIGADRIEDFIFSNHSSIEVLQLSGTSDVTLGSAAASSGISTVYGGSGATSLDASARSSALEIDLSAGSGASFVLGGSGTDNITGGSGADTLQGWATGANTASDTLFGGAGADLFVLGDASGNGYGASGSKALISDFTGGTDYLQLKDYAGSGASAYRVDANAGSGYTHQLFDTHTGSDVLVANINYSGSNATGDLLGSKALFA
jgi:Ca2+-binding RTX toxin-like protein